MKQKKNNKFDENTFNNVENKNKFSFNLGPKNNCKIILDKKTSNQIEEAFKTELIKLSYL